MHLKSLVRRRQKDRTPRNALPAPAISGQPGHRWRGWWIVAGVVLGVLLLVQLVGTPLATHFLNRRLTQLEGYTGRAGMVNIVLWRAAITLSDFDLRERGHEGEPPIVQLRKGSLRLAPLALFRGKLGGAAVIDGLVVNLTKREQIQPKEAADKAGEKAQKAKAEVQQWQDALRRSLPVTLSHLEITNAELRYVDRSHLPNPEVRLTELHIIARDLQNQPKANGDLLPTKVELTGRLTGNGSLRATLQLDPVARQPRFATRFEIRDLQLPPLNSFLMAYADADVARGSFELFMEADAKDGGYEGYVKPILRDLDFRTASDEHKNAAQKLKEKIVSAVTSVFKNDEQQQVATRAPFRGNFADNRVDIWTTVAELFHNAFVQALRSGFEGQVPRR